MGSAVAEVKEALQEFADRGVFTQFKVSEPGGSRPADFQFQWLAESAFHLKLYESKRQLVIHKVLPGVPFRSSMDKEFREFLAGRSDKSVPRHRRLDSKRFSPQCRNSKGAISVALTFKKGDGSEATRTAISLLHEIFNNFLMEGPYQNYMVEIFGIAEE